MNFFEFQLF